MSILFLHPDLGIGGAERAVVDAAMAAKSLGYEVEIITNFHDPKHAFEETVDGSLKVTTVCQWIPRSLMGRFIALFAFFKMLIAAVWIVFARRKDAALVFVDQVSAPVIILKLFGLRVIFYGHFPDLLLSSHKSSLQKIYRYPLDRLEEFSTGRADTLVVNSHFTGSIFKKTFPSLKNRNLRVLYPVPNIDKLVLPPTVLEKTSVESYWPPNADLVLQHLEGVLGKVPKIMFLSINRYERKKNIQLFFESFAYLKDNWAELIEDSSISPSDILCVHAGGYDSRVSENVEHFEELADRLEKLDISELCLLLRSVTSDVKCQLIAGSAALVYTPAFEHFGIVPVEAMFLGRPVIAIGAGGPLETVVDGETGFLCPHPPSGTVPNSQMVPTIAGYMSKLINDRELVMKMGKRAHEHVLEEFSTEAFRKQFARILEDTLADSGDAKKQE